MRLLVGLAATIAVAGFVTAAAAWEYRVSTDDWLRLLGQNHREVMQGIKYGNADTLQRASHALTRLVADVRAWPQADGPWTVARINCGLAAQSLSNFADDVRRGGQRGAAAADGSLRDYNGYLATCRSAAAKIKKGAS